MTKGLVRSLSRAVGGGKRQPIIKQRIRIVNKTISVVNGAPGYGSVALFGLPEGNLLIHGAIGYLVFSTSDADITSTFDGDVAVGTTADANGTLAGAEVNFFPSTPLNAATAKVSPNVRLATTATTHSVIIDNTAADVVFYANLLIDDAAISGAADFLINGYIEVVYTVLGDD